MSVASKLTCLLISSRSFHFWHPFWNRDHFLWLTRSRVPVMQTANLFSDKGAALDTPALPISGKIGWLVGLEREIHSPINRLLSWKNLIFCGPLCKHHLCTLWNVAFFLLVIHASGCLDKIIASGKKPPQVRFSHVLQTIFFCFCFFQKNTPALPRVISSTVRNTWSMTRRHF